MLLTFSEAATLFGIAYGVFIVIAVFHGVLGLKTVVTKWLETRETARAADVTAVARPVHATTHRFEHGLATAGAVAEAA